MDAKSLSKINRAIEIWRRLNVFCSSWEQSQIVLTKCLCGSDSESLFLKNKDLERPHAKVESTKKRKISKINLDDPQIYEPYIPEMKTSVSNPSSEIQHLLSLLSTSTIISSISIENSTHHSSS